MPMFGIALQGSTNQADVGGSLRLRPLTYPEETTLQVEEDEETSGRVENGEVVWEAAEEGEK